MISKGSCDTEVWSNDAENTALPHRQNIFFFKYIGLKNSFEKKNIYISVSNLKIPK